MMHCWVSVKDAATICGVSTRAVRKWVSTGKCYSRIAPGNGGGEYLVRIDSIPSDFREKALRITENQLATFAKSESQSSADNNGRIHLKTNNLEEVANELSSISHLLATLMLKVANLQRGLSNAD